MIKALFSAALRASLGRPEPFKLLYIEIGNEDFFAANSYVYRWRRFVTALQREFPQLRMSFSLHVNHCTAHCMPSGFIATTNPGNPVLTPAPTEYDVHVYQTPSDYILVWRPEVVGSRTDRAFGSS
jgi:alpha-N-arabinofuranosidase